MNSSAYAVALGTCIMDVTGFVSGDFVPGDKNPGSKIHISTGGAARNIGDNLARLGYPVKLISVVGDDGFGTVMLEDCAKSGMDVTNIERIKGRSSAVYLALLNGEGNMVTALTDLELALVQDVEFYKKYHEVLKNAKIIEVTSESTPEVIEYLHMTYPSIPIIGDVATIGLLGNMISHISYYDTIKANELEAQTLSGVEINNESSICEAAKKIVEMGVGHVIITLGGDGVYYLDAQGNSYRMRQKKIDKMVNATGAGDAFTAGYIYKKLGGADIPNALEFAMSTAVIALQNESTISPDMSVARAEEIMKEYRI